MCSATKAAKEAVEDAAHSHAAGSMPRKPPESSTTFWYPHYSTMLCLLWCLE